MKNFQRFSVILSSDKFRYFLISAVPFFIFVAVPGSNGQCSDEPEYQTQYKLIQKSQETLPYVPNKR